MPRHELGFVWNPRDAYFEKMFAALVEYKEAHGDCNVPARWSENPKLAKHVIAGANELTMSLMRVPGCLRAVRALGSRAFSDHSRSYPAAAK